MSMAFTASCGLRDTVTYPTIPASETAAREQVQGRLDEIRDYVNKHSVYLSDTGSANALAVTLPVSLTSPTTMTDMLFLVKPAAANTSTGTATMTVASSSGTIGTANITKRNGAALQAGDILAGETVMLQYSSSAGEWRLLTLGDVSDKLTTKGDLLYASAANTPTRLPIGSTNKTLIVDATSGVPKWEDSLQSLMTAQGDLVYAGGAATPARLAIGTANYSLCSASTNTVPIWQPSPRSIMSTKGDLLYASAANTPDRIAVGSGGQVLATATSDTVPKWVNAGWQTIETQYCTTDTSVITFSTIDTVYKFLKVFFSAQSSTATAGNLIMAVNGTTVSGGAAFKILGSSTSYVGTFSGTSAGLPNSLPTNVDGYLAYGEIGMLAHGIDATHRVTGTFNYGVQESAPGAYYNGCFFVAISADISSLAFIPSAAFIGARSTFTLTGLRG